MIHLTDELMSKHSTFKIGGVAKNVYIPESLEEFKGLYSNEFIVIGNGSNILFGDGIIETPIIITTKMNKFYIDGEKIIAECGALIINIALSAAKNGLSGLEFAGSIPATIGGCVYMNAGAHGGQMSNIVESTEVLKENIGLRGASATRTYIINNAQHEFGYRTSIFQHTKEIILATNLKLKQDNPNKIIFRMNEHLENRKKNQPIGQPSDGSIFKKLDGISAGQLIEECGLKGYTIGGAQVSQRHAGFIVNIGNASAQNVLNLIEFIKNKVYEEKGIKLEEEIRYIQ